MNLLSPLKTIMTKELITLDPNDELRKVKNVFENTRIHHIPIVENDELKGIVSKSDFLFFSRGFNGDKKDIKLERFRLNTNLVKEIMTKGVATLSSDQKINVALELFNENIFHAIPIVDDGKLVGIVTTLDIIKTLSIDKEATNKYL